MFRGGLGVVLGWIVWFVAFLALAVGLAAVWPEYGVHGRAWMNDHVFDFTTPMALLNVLFWILAEVAAGWVALFVGRRREALWILAAIVGLYLGYEHLYAEWTHLPTWYNLAVAVSGIPAVLLGGGLVARSRRGRTPLPA